MLSINTLRCILLSLMLAIPFGSFAQDLPLVQDGGRRLPVLLQSASGVPLRIGTLVLSPANDGWNYRVELDRARFEERFLAMRPFICLEEGGYSLCHLSYPYPLERRITRQDLVDLEYDLLFIQKQTAEYGIDAHKGIYYRLAWKDKRIEGRLYETDLDRLAVPPDADVKRPITEQELYEVEGSRHAWPKIVIGEPD